MKKSNSNQESQQLAAKVQKARLLVATAEKECKAAQEEAQVARCKRKEAKIIVRRSRKDAKQAEADLAAARKALAKAEAKLAEGAARLKTKKPADATTSGKKKAAPSRKRPALPTVPSPAPQITPAFGIGQASVSAGAPAKTK